MERSLIKEVNKKGMLARISSKKVKPLLFPNFFQIQPVSSLRYETLVGEKGVPVMADVIAFDASAPEKTRQTVSKLSGDIPKIALKRSMNESAYNDYINLRNKASGSASLLALLDLVYNDLDFVYNGVRARMEWLAFQAFSKGSITLTSSNNNGLITEQIVDFQVPSDNKLKASVAWSDSANAKPLDDIESVVAAARDLGITLQYVVMNTNQFNQLKNATATINAIKGFLNTKVGLVVRQDTINEYLAANLLPRIIVIDPAVRFEDGKHARTVVHPWEENRVTFIPDVVVGQIQHGPIAAEGNAQVQKIATMVKKDFVLASKWSTIEPFKEWTKAEANAFPVLSAPDELFLFRSDATNW